MASVRPKKYLGQHFLTDLRAAQRIVNLLTAPAEQTVVEIGPGTGVLTQYLIPRYSRLKLVEIDPESIAYLREHYPPIQDKIIEADVLEWELAADVPPNSAFIGNLPYNISSPIFFKLLEHRDQFSQGVFMLQKEVAQRLAAGPGSKTYGILSVLLGHYYQVDYAFSVPPGAFRPPPKVQSGVIRLVRREAAEELDFGRFKHLVKTAFNQRRKTLRNALKSIPLDDFPEKDDLLQKRAEQLPVSDFVRLTRAMR